MSEYSYIDMNADEEGAREKKIDNRGSFWRKDKGRFKE